MRHRYNFRLSDDADAILKRFAKEYGLKNTAIIELAIRTLAQHPPFAPKDKQAYRDGPIWRCGACNEAIGQPHLVGCVFEG